MTNYGTIPTSSSGSKSISRAKERIRVGLGSRRPWKQMFDYHTISLPSSLSNAIQRLKENLSFFLMNYIIVSLVILFLSLLWHPISLLVFVFMMAAWLFLYFLRDEPLIVFNRTIHDRLVIVTLALFTLVFLFLTDATWNIVGSIAVAALLVLIHVIFRNTEDLADEESGVMYSAVPAESA